MKNNCVVFSALVMVSFALCITADEIVDEKTEEPQVLYSTPFVQPDSYFADHFDMKSAFEMSWIMSEANKDAEEKSTAKYDGVWKQEAALINPLVGDMGLVLKSKAKHSAISSNLRKPFMFDSTTKPFLIQYEVNFQNGLDCGGGYIKLLTHVDDTTSDPLKKFTDKTPYTIMFGPDKCGSDSKLHFIFRHINPINKTISEKHCKKLGTKEKGIFEEAVADKHPHLYRLIVRPDSTYEVSIDRRVVNHGSLMTDFTPSINPPAEIEDPNDVKPSTWDSREKIVDPNAKKPEDWDEEAPRKIVDEAAVMPNDWIEHEESMIADPEAERPEDWDTELDGDWEPPLIDNPACKDISGCGKWNKPTIDNPAYKGKWKAPLISNPAYSGVWSAATIPNPDYYYDAQPYLNLSPIGAVGFELWSMSNDIYFDNILITDELALADQWASETFDLKQQNLDVSEAGLFKRIMLYSNRNPWLYAVYVVLVGVPMVLIFTFCFSSSPLTVSTVEGDKTVHHKKTDEDNIADQEEEFVELEAGGDLLDSKGEPSDDEGSVSDRVSLRKRRAKKE